MECGCDGRPSLYTAQTAKTYLHKYITGDDKLLSIDTLDFLVEYVEYQYRAMQWLIYDKLT